MYEDMRFYNTNCFKWILIMNQAQRQNYKIEMSN